MTFSSHLISVNNERTRKIKLTILSHLHIHIRILLTLWIVLCVLLILQKYLFIIIERHRGLMVRAITCGAEGPRIQNHLQKLSGGNSLCSHSSKWVPDSFRKGLGGEGRGDGHQPLHAVPNDTCEP